MNDGGKSEYERLLDKYSEIADIAGGYFFGTILMLVYGFLCLLLNFIVSGIPHTILYWLSITAYTVGYLFIGISFILSVTFKFYVPNNGNE